MATSPPWSRVSTICFYTFGTLQIIGVISLIGFVTYWIGFLGVKSEIVTLKYVYITLLTTTIIFLILLTMEAVAYIQSTMTDFFPRFHKLGAWKMRIVLVEFLTLAVLLHNVEELGVVASVLMLTGLSRAPFKCSFVLASLMARKESKRLEKLTKEGGEGGEGEESPLLP